MTVIRQFSCDYCNPAHERRDEGYAAELGDNFPLGWWEVPRKGPEGSVGHACPSCVLTPEVNQDITARRSEDTRRMMGEPDAAEGSGSREQPDTDDDERPRPAWPSRASPFVGESGPGD